jgi:RHH-type proline utilization regulon transcriptional repressor/proline dehydrogenase/delta 1-pyrroline-5-carboxylate dehydrogenase
MTAMTPFRAPYAPADEPLAAALLREARLPAAAEARIDACATTLIEAIRRRTGGLGGVEDVLREYSLSTREGLALMVLAEALLRVPDGATADRLIEDKLGQGDFAHHEPKSEAFLVNASAWALGITARIIQPGETPTSILAGLAKRIGLPTVRTATRQAMRVMGSHFVLGETIEEALRRATAGSARNYRYSFDMLGEGARTAEDAERYLASYSAAIEAIGRAAGNEPLPNRPGISVKLSALHPRYEAISRRRVLDELVPKVVDLALQARGHDLNFTIDAEEADRLELSLDVLAAVLADDRLRGWEGFGLAIQAYQKRARAVIAWVDALTRQHDTRLMVRLVKGAYWDTEVKRTQERGLADYPVWTRKPMTDLAYLACARDLLNARPRLYPQFATHNALTVATILELAGDPTGFEFQRLHGMGEALYEKLLADVPAAACRVYAPVGGHKDLLAYLVRRLLENGANSSFVNVAGDPNVPIATLLARPADVIGDPARARHRHLPLPAALYGPSRPNSAGVELGHEAELTALLAEIAAATPPTRAASRIGGKPQPGEERALLDPTHGKTIGTAQDGNADTVARAMEAAARAFPAWDRTEVSQRAAVLERLADLLQQRRGLLLRLLQTEGGKTLDDAVAELREAIDFCRYYAADARHSFAPEGEALPGPTGESNRLRHRGRGVFVCISPWNFPLAIFLGQVAAALLAGNSVVAKPAEQTPLIACTVADMLAEAGIPAGVYNLLIGGGTVGAALVAHRQVAGVAFTGSTEVARLINRALAAKDGPIVPLIAETGGINTMIVDATALPEQVADDVVMSAFRSAGQRCSALRLLCVQEDVADTIIAMVAGAARELKLGDPAEPDTHIGPVIDREALDRLTGHAARMQRSARTHLTTTAPAHGTFFGPHIFELKRVEDLTEEVFGPILHVVRYRAGALPELLRAVAASGYGLTMGVHTRIDETVERVAEALPVGNLYINRNMIGAVVGTQPFGGSGLSGTGPKAGGPHYLKRFGTEQVITVNTAAAGGNAGLIGMDEE